nr:MoxR family ATPase [Ardenticatenales bacterium]
LLLEGDPGSGKTRLAYAVAYELGYPLKCCYIRSTSRAQDLLYTYDAVGRLYDIQESRVGEERQAAPSREKYVTLGDLGEAIRLSEQGIPSVVLIDEIDKADIDFPNDLLLVLDRLEFSVDEVQGMEYSALQGKPRDERRDVLPLVIITSNREKELPKPFLRRCLFYYIPFPEQEELSRIMESHFQKGMTPLFAEALKRFWHLRHQEVVRWRKTPSTSELLDWVQLLERDEQRGRLTAEDLATRPVQALPHLGALVKTQSDRDALNKVNS